MASKKTSSSAHRPPSKHHYVRIAGPAGMRVYVTNLALREIAPLLIQDSVTEVLGTTRSKTPASRRFAAGRGKSFTVRVDPLRGETHVQMAKET